MKKTRKWFTLGLTVFCGSLANANLLINGNLDVTYQQEIVPGSFQPKPNGWKNVGTRSIQGGYENEMSSETWAGPAPTPVTTDGHNVTSGDTTNDDWGVFFKPFTGNATFGTATGHLYQDHTALTGATYTLTGWAGAEANALMDNAVFALDFLNDSSQMIGGIELSLMPTLKAQNGQPFNYKQYSITAVAPKGSSIVRSRVSMIGGFANPQGGGQAFVVDDFVLTEAVPEPATTSVLVLSGIAAWAKRRRTS